VASDKQQIAEWRAYRKDSVKRAAVCRSRGDISMADSFDKLTVQWDELLARNGIEPDG
jgi:hypothetical protein